MRIRLVVLLALAALHCKGQQFLELEERAAERAAKLHEFEEKFHRSISHAIPIVHNPTPHVPLHPSPPSAPARLENNLKLWHFVWTIPKDDERGYNNARTFDFSHLTGCCDRSVSLAIASILAIYPEAEVWLWSDTPSWSSELIRSKLVDSPRLVFKYFDGAKEASDFANVAKFYAEPKPWPHRSIVWSDLTRYTVVRNYGGSYLDADTSLLRPISDTLEKIGRGNVPADTPLLNLSPTGSKSPHTAFDCKQIMLNEINRPEGTYCASSNGVLVNFPPKHWLLNDTLAAINKEGRIFGRFFNAFGPFYLTQYSKFGQDAGKPLVPKMMHFLSMVATRPLITPYSEHYYTNTVGAKEAALHTELDHGDIKDGTLAHFLLCKHLRAIGIRNDIFRCSDSFKEDMLYRK